ncbi:hypothetical protein [Lactobacillus phage Maenad]|uniref:Uncharacterized protein n=1 Tax=Lactobacillus phage Maenad TaxID=2079431 RepID=A0A2P0ZKW1_9CAUD|nr:hypothetical protein HOS85_gp054 [Lactobacillus phage Maenad]AVH85628.1 hypothetical protein [Lactobacillus phage Maenad]
MEGNQIELLEQLWYLQGRVKKLEEKLETLQLENDDLHYELYELKGEDKDDEE